MILETRDGEGLGKECDKEISAWICCSLRVDLWESEEDLVSGEVRSRLRTAKVRTPAMEYFRYFESCIYVEVG